MMVRCLKFLIFSEMGLFLAFEIYILELFAFTKMVKSCIYIYKTKFKTLNCKFSLWY